MKLCNTHAEIFAPDRVSPSTALARTTHMGIGAHQDDLEFMALHGILSCFQREDRWFAGVTVTDGRGCARANEYAKYSDKRMMAVRRKEQRKAAVVGEYGAMVSLDYSSAAIKARGNRSLVGDLKALVSAAGPDFIYTHNLADKHDTHLAVAIPVIQALRELPKAKRPKALYGCEVWRSLDWMRDEDKTVFDVSARENISASLMGLFDSQISGGKRYDTGTLGRKRSNATYFSSHATDRARLLEFAMDLTPLIHNPNLDIAAYVCEYIERFSTDARARIAKFLPR